MENWLYPRKMLNQLKVQTKNSRDLCIMRIAVLVSGNGSNLQALIDANLSGANHYVLSNKADAYALQRAGESQYCNRCYFT